MRLVIVTNNPDRASFRQRIGVYLETLRRAGIDCEIARIPPGSAARRRFYKRAGEFDGVFLHKQGLNPLDAMWLRKFGKRIIFNFDDAVMYSDKNPHRHSHAHFVPFRRSAKLADLIICGSSYLAEQARPFNSNVEILPLGLRVADYQLSAPAATDGRVRLVWVGSASTVGYLEGIKPAIEQVSELCDNLVLRMICDVFPAFENVAVEEHLWSEDTLAADLTASNIGLAPLPDNPFTRGKCSFKVLEYSAAGLAVVASPVGTNAEHVREGVTGFLAASNDDWVERITQLVTDPPLRADMGRRGHEFAAKYDVSVIGGRLTELIRNCLCGS